MKSYFTIILIAVIFLINLGNSVYAQVSEADAKTVLNSIFDASSKEDYNKASSLLMFEKVLDKRAYNNSDPAEQKSVKRICKKIKAYIDLSDSYEVSGSKSVNMQGLNGTVLDVVFKSGDQKLNIAFTFLNVSGKILLSDFK
ncbi:MAG: hypothetical protein HYS24_04385 [Ignavibacteriales bacterium]|nr:hypothetical protein [Ignavibacteriales bacterium]